MLERLIDRVKSALGVETPAETNGTSEPTASPGTTDPVFQELLEWIPGARLILDPGEIRVYECDGLPIHKGPPTAVVLCTSQEDVIRTLRWCHRRRIPFVPRGAGTGLSGGATPVKGGVIVDCNRMKRILKVDHDNRTIVVEPGVINIRVSEAVKHSDLHYAPDPSSQKACTIGGNVSENSGGPHCLKYGMSTDHIIALKVVLPDGEVVTLGGPQFESSGYDLAGVFVGTEGTFGIVIEATLRLVPRPKAIRTYLAIFDSMSLACRMVSRITEEGILPASLEILDQRIIQAIESSVFAAGYPEEAAAVLLIEIDGVEEGLDEEELRIQEIAVKCHAIEFRAARDAKEQAELWKGRKSAFGVMGRIKTDLYVLDGVVPRTKLESVLEEISAICDRRNVLLSNVFHAGDGNLHPNLSYDGRDPDECKRVVNAGREILQACVDAGGSISGEHGIGLEKSEFLPLLFSDEDIRVMVDLRHAVDPLELSNPEKIFPDNRSCNEAGKRRYMKIPEIQFPDASPSHDTLETDTLKSDTEHSPDVPQSDGDDRNSAQRTSETE